MGPYLAVLSDSFRAAWSSRVLWVALVAIWILLGVLAPIGYREDFTTDFRGGDFRNATRLKALLAQGLVDPESQDQAIGRIAAKLPEDLRRELTRVGNGDEVRIWYSVLSDGLNQLLDDESWYDAAAWKSSHRLRELRELDPMPTDQLSNSLRRRRARLRLESVLPGVFQSRSSRSIIITYAGMDFPTPVAVDKPQFVIVVNQFVMPFIIDWALGFALVLLGILVTAPIIPDMLQPGSLHLLLSKPISRPMLLLSKFIGGCSFVFLCVVQLIVGLYLIAGLRLDLWNARLLFCIPVSVFSFAVYYSISLVAGLRWRSPILSIGVTVMCGTFFLLVGFFGSVADDYVTAPDSLRGLALVGDRPIAATRGGGLVRFDPVSNRWNTLIESNLFGGDKVLAPIRLSDSSVATAVVKGGQFNPFGSGSLDMLVLSDTNQWKPEPSLRLPAGTTDLYAIGQDTVLALNTSDLVATTHVRVMEAAGEVSPQGTSAAASSPPADDDAKSEPQAAAWSRKLGNMLGIATDGFTNVLPAKVSLPAPRGLVFDRNGKWLIAWSRGRLVRLDRSAGDAPWIESASQSLEGESSLRGAIGLSDNTVMLSRSEGLLQFFDSQSLAPITELNVPNNMTPIDVAGLNDGRFVMVTGDSQCHLVQPTDEHRRNFEIGATLPFTKVSQCKFDQPTNTLVLIHHIDQVDSLQVPSLEVKQQIRPTLVGWRLIDKFVMSPLRMTVPQTGELSDIIASLISGKSSVSIPGGLDEGEIVQYDIFRPIVSCSTFIVIMLTIGCIYFSTRDF